MNMPPVSPPVPSPAPPGHAGAGLFSIDVEDWYHILDLPGTPAFEEWDALPARVEANFMRLLDILSEHRARATCFFLGYVARRYPGLVREARTRGHEIASHGYAHRLVYTLTPAEFGEDARQARRVLEDAGGVAVRGYRCAGFSLTERETWFFDELAAAGYTYDSSVFPAARGHGGMAGGSRRPHLVSSPKGGIFELPISVTPVLGRPLYFFGGGYLRLFPYGVVRAMARRVLREGRPVIFYVHPREIDPGHPRLAMSATRRFRSYVNLATTERKVRQILADFPGPTFSEYVAGLEPAPEANR
jgi:polysaccharide deacetylase family protein (PEP-CTERM system associated)